MREEQQKRVLGSDEAVLYQLQQERLLRSIRMLQVLMLILIVMVGVLLFRLSQISDQVAATVRSVDEIHLGISDMFKQGLPELQEAQTLAKQLKADLAVGGGLSQRLDEATDRAIEKAKREIPSAVDAIIEQKLKDFDARVRRLRP